jgi:hypothetical protein
MLHRLLAAKQKNLNFNAVLLHCGKGIDKLTLVRGYANNIHRDRVRTRNITSLQLALALSYTTNDLSYTTNDKRALLSL